MKPLEHITTGVDNTAAEIWACFGSFSTATAIGPLLREAAWIMRQAKIHASNNRIPGVETIEADVASRVTHLQVHIYSPIVQHFIPTAHALEAVPPSIRSDVEAT